MPRKPFLPLNYPGKLFGTNWLKLEIHPDPRYLLPDPVETLKATEELAKLGFIVLPYCQADPVLCKRLEDAGAATVMPLGAPIGTNQGLQTREFLRIIIEQSNIPVVVDAGIGAPSHAAEAMELGADAVLVNTAIAVAGNPVEMAKAFKVAVEAGRMAYEAGLAGKKYRCRSKQSSDRFLEINRQSDLILIICFRKNLKNIPGKKRPGKSTLKQPPM